MKMRGKSCVGEVDCGLFFRVKIYILGSHGEDDTVLVEWKPPREVEIQQNGQHQQ